MNNRIQLLKSFLAEDPADVFCRYALALEYLNTGETDEAIRRFTELMESEPGYLATYYQFGKALEIKQAFELATSVYKKGMDLARKEGAQQVFNELNEAFRMLHPEDLEES